MSVFVPSRQSVSLCITGGDFLGTLSASYIDLPVGGDRWRLYLVVSQ